MEEEAEEELDENTDDDDDFKDAESEEAEEEVEEEDAEDEEVKENTEATAKATGKGSKGKVETSKGKGSSQSAEGQKGLKAKGKGKGKEEKRPAGKGQTSEDKSSSEQRERRSGQLNPEELKRLNPVGDTGLALGAGMVCVVGEEIEEGNERAADDFCTVKTKKQQRSERQLQKKAEQEEAKKAQKREARKLRQQRAKSYKAAAKAVEEELAQAAPTNQAPPEPKHEHIDLFALRRSANLERGPEEHFPADVRFQASQEDWDFRHQAERSDRAQQQMYRSEDGEWEALPRSEWHPQMPSRSAREPTSSYNAGPMGYQTGPGHAMGGDPSYGSFAFGVERPPRPSREISEIWERSAGAARSSPSMSSVGDGLHGPPPPYRPPSNGRIIARTLRTVAEAAAEAAGAAAMVGADVTAAAAAAAAHAAAQCAARHARRSLEMPPTAAAFRRMGMPARMDRPRGP